MIFFDLLKICGSKNSTERCKVKFYQRRFSLSHQFYRRIFTEASPLDKISFSIKINVSTEIDTKLFKRLMNSA